MESPGKDEEMKVDYLDENDYTSDFFDEDQLRQLKEGGSYGQSDQAFSQQTLSNFMAKGNFNDDDEDERE